MFKIFGVVNPEEGLLIHVHISSIRKPPCSPGLEFIFSVGRVLIVCRFFVHVHKEQLKINYILQLIFVPAFFLLNHCIILPFPKEDVVGFT